MSLHQLRLSTTIFDQPGDHSTAAGRVEVTIYRAAVTLRLPSGRLVAGDPSYITHNVEPMHVTIQPGEYPVDLAVGQYVGGDQRVLAARVRLLDRPTARFATLRPGTRAVDSGVWGFTDADAPRFLHALLDHDADLYWRQINGAMQPNYQPTRAWGQMDVQGNPALNLVTCYSGMGDGEYASYRALDDRDALVAIVTDFGLLASSDEIDKANQRKWWRFWR